MQLVTFLNLAFTYYTYILPQFVTQEFFYPTEQYSQYIYLWSHTDLQGEEAVSEVFLETGVGGRHQS